MSKTGLVLSGGGAKGAYQVGVMQALIEINVEIDMISGASIGALNGGVLASAPNLKVGTERLDEIWDYLSENNPLQLRDTRELVKVALPIVLPYLTFLVSAGLRAHPAVRTATMVYWALKNISQYIDIPEPALLKEITQDNEFKSVLTDKTLQEMMDKYLDIEQLQKSIPFYVSVFEQDNYSAGFLDIAKAEILGIDNKGSSFKQIQSFPVNEQKDMLLASAAIPLAFESKTDSQGNILTDGGQGGWVKAQGNTPITPLVEAGCDYVIVTHLNNGSLWHRHDFPNVTCIEIRPNPKLDLGFSAMFDFSKEKIQQLQKAGYEDTMQQLGEVKETLHILSNKRNSMNQLDKLINQPSDSQNKLNDAMTQLRKLK